MFDESGEAIEEAGPSKPAVILGLSGVPYAGDEVLVVANERKAPEKPLHSGRTSSVRAAWRSNRPRTCRTCSIIWARASRYPCNLLIRADVQGSVEALKDALVKLSNDEVKVNVVASGVGAITESDASLAQAPGPSSLVSMCVLMRARARLSRNTRLDLHYYSIIYEAIDEVKAAISGLLGTETRETIIGLAEVRDVFRSSKLGAIAGCLVVEGHVKRTNPIRVLRDNVVIFEGELESLRRFKDDVSEVQSGTECGIGVKMYNDVKPGDEIECFERTEVARTLD